ncbi:A24 family peptidase [Ruminococcus sp. Marseille-P6503]|uniref:prepilin peptidase n=1 Tax=Ruminococcus sp. Marseille-P6503 TaxID=2364796 RepID=UPI000F53BCB9|nr:A24 family peptidase [Ruminococcus sp. Marseille-P6503]
MDTQYYIYVAIIYIFIFLFGAAVGSFLNVCIYRLPKEESLIRRKSHCTSCGEPIKRRDLIPIISWCVLKGKCRSCGAKISPRYTVVELLNALCWLYVAWHFDVLIQPVRFIFTALLFSALIVVFFMDWDTQLISTYVVIFIGLLSIPNYIFCHEAMGTELSSHIIGFFAVSVPLLLIELLSKGKAMGRGDVYLMAAGGLFLGVQNILAALFIGLISGSIAGLIIKYKTENSVFAFGPWLSLGIAVSALYGDRLVQWYMTFTGLTELLA